MSEKRKSAVGRLSLLAATVIWGSSFVVLKNTLDAVPTFYVLAFRFTGAAVITFFIGVREFFPGKWGADPGGAGKIIDRDCLGYGVMMGLCLFCAYVLQTFGLIYTTPGINAFLTATYCVMVPFLGWLVYRIRLDRYNVIAALVCITGMALVSVQGNMTVGLGEALTSACGLFYALHIIITARGVRKHSVMLMSTIQFAVVALLSWPFALLTESFPASAPASAWLAVVYLCVMCTAACMLLQATGQKYTPPAPAAVLLTFESVFGTVISVIFYGEELSARLIFGFLLIFCAVLISETKLGFLVRRSAPTL